VRTAIYGGTFDPIHLAHIRVAHEALKQFRLDRILFVPAANPPHKKTGTSFEDRFRMVELACRQEPRFVPSRLEEGRSRSYSVVTLHRLKQMLPDDELFFLIGADAFEEVETWYRCREVLGLTEFIVVSRPGYEYDIPEGARVHRLESLDLAISSSMLRAELARGESPAELPDSVLGYIRDNALYR
jgi:nicotinate-nucleotide adenylyltransferase